MSDKRVFSVLIFTVLFATCISENGRNALNRSKRSSNDVVEHWIREVLDAMANLMKAGFPELGIPSLEPVKLEDFSYDGGAAGARVKANFTNMNLYGLSTLRVDKVKADMSKLKLELKLKFSNLTIIGRYNMTGTMLMVFPLRGNDTFDLVATDVTLKGDSALKTFANGSVAMTDLQLDMKVDKVKAHFHKINGGGNTSGLVNRIINFFSDNIFDRTKPKLVKKMKDVLEPTINRKLRSVNIFKM